MAGIYLHIPFCRKACHYCNFHFSTSLKHKNDLIAGLLWELKEKRNLLKVNIIETIYFGGGTPSLLAPEDIQKLLQTIFTNYNVASDREITLEANPDDIHVTNLHSWRNAGINRLSIGIQSFREEDLIRMNRSHSADQALRCIPLAQEAGFENLTLDLIFGYPELDDLSWKNNIDTAIALNVPHISCYAMTVEPKTALAHQIKKGLAGKPDNDHSAKQYHYVMQRLAEAGYEHYEISSYAKPGYRAVHNSNYWNQVHYIGIGPSAHSFNGLSRSWNIANNALYIKQTQNKQLEPETEILTREQRINEIIMVRLRVKEGLKLAEIENELSDQEAATWHQIKKQFINDNYVVEENGYLKLTQQGKLFADHIAASLFL